MRVQLLLFADNMSNVLAAHNATGDSAFPTLQVNSDCRVAEGVSKWCQENLSVDIYCLSLKEMSKDDESLTAVARTLTDSTVRGEEKYRWLPVSTAMRNACLSRPLHVALLHLERSRLGEEDDVFGCYDWVDRFTTLAQTAVGGRIHKFRQVNVGSSFTLIHLESERGSHWFKAVENDNIREYPVTHHLHRHFPGFVPAIVSSCPEWNGWLSEHVQGLLLADLHDVNSWRDVFARFAKLQICSLSHLDNLARVGAVSWTVRRMSDLLDEFFAGMPAIMSRQEQEPPARLRDTELQELREQMKTICLEMQSLNIPDTIFHGDLCPKNIVVSEHGPVFLDWAETYIGNPFLNAELLLSYFRNHFRSDEAEARARSMQEAFNGPWLELLSRESIERAWQLAACLAPLLNALYLSSVSTHNILPATKQDAFRRTLVRVMKRESDYLEILACR